MARRWVIADLHLDDERIIAYTNRPFIDAKNMNKSLVQNWNSIVDKDDTVYVLGDFTVSKKYRKIKKWCSKLNGRKILILGKNDKASIHTYLKAGFIEVTSKPILLEPRLTLMCEPPKFEDIWFRMFYIFGRVHNVECDADKFGNCAGVSAERVNYTPVDLDKLIDVLDPCRGPEYGD